MLILKYFQRVPKPSNGLPDPMVFEIASFSNTASQQIREPCDLKAGFRTKRAILTFAEVSSREMHADNQDYQWYALLRKQTMQDSPNFYSPKVSGGKFAKVFLHPTFTLSGTYFLSDVINYTLIYRTVKHSNRTVKL